MAEALPEPEDDGDRKLLADIARVGWAVVGVPGGGEAPGYASSVGLHRTFGHPEVVLIGLPWAVSHRFINDIGAAVQGGKRYEAGREYDDLVQGYPAAFVAVDRGHYRGYLARAGWLYRGWDFPAVQMVWCDRDRRWPWDPGAAPEYWRCQPLLGLRDDPGGAPDTGRDMS